MKTWELGEQVIVEKFGIMGMVLALEFSKFREIEKIHVFVGNGIVITEPKELIRFDEEPKWRH